MIRKLMVILVSVMAFSALADTYSISSTIQKQILEEADDWIDDMPEGLQDRLADALNHSLAGFGNELDYFRNMADTTGNGSYQVFVKDISPQNGLSLPLRFYTADQSPISGNKAVEKLLLVYFHGGGYSLGSPNAVDKFCRALAAFGNVNIVSVAYPLAPENKLASIIEQSRQTVSYIFENTQEFDTNPSMISLGGDGAGGNLALNLWSIFRENKDSYNIRSLVLYYPLLNLTGPIDTESKRKFGRGFGLDSRLLESFYSMAENGGEGLNLLTAISQFNDFNLPVLLIEAGRDIIIKEEKEFSSLSDSIISVNFEGAIHGFITDGHQKEAFNQAVNITDSFLKE